MAQFGPPVHGRWECLARAITSVTVDGFWAEFGVYRGQSLRFIAGMARQPVTGFDSFQGLPEAWNGLDVGAFRTSVPTADSLDLPKNASLVVGPFDGTIAAWVGRVRGPAAFLHVDCDVYSSARTVLAQTRERMVKGTVIVFDELYNYPGWEEHEYRALLESEIPFKYLCHNEDGEQVAVRVT